MVAGVAAGLHARIRTLRERQLAALSDTALDAHLADALKLATMVSTSISGCTVPSAWCLGSSPSPAATCSAGTRPECSHCWAAPRPPQPNRLGRWQTSPPWRVRKSAHCLAQAAPADEVLAADEEFAGGVRRLPTRVRLPHISAYELAEPSLEERPDLVLALVRDQLDSGLTPGRQQELARQREAAANEARAGLSGD